MSDVYEGHFEIYTIGVGGGKVTRKTVSQADAIQPDWSSIMTILGRQSALHPYAGPGHWNDPDMLEVANGELSAGESRAHFALWAMLAAPLIAGNDLRAMSDDTVAIRWQRVLEPMQRLYDTHRRTSCPVELAGGGMLEVDLQVVELNRTASSIGVDHNDSAIVAAVVAMAGALGLEVTAEGVETQQQLDGLRALGCQLAQGFKFSPALSADGFAAFVRRSRA